MKPETFSTREIILALASMPKRARNLLGKGKKYEAILQEILKYDSEAEDSHLPSSKELQQETKTDAKKCKEHIVEIYKDFLASMGNEVALYESNKFRCEFFVQYFDKFQSFYGILPVVPRLGDEMELRFLRPIFNIDIFYVERIKHILQDECQVIELWLKGGFENTYERFYIDKAKYERRYDYIRGKIYD